MDRTLLLVTGAGRSGTSTIAGTLSLLGLHVPGPFLKTNDSNPKGFYESQWSAQFHNRILKRANVSIADGRPDALTTVRSAIRPADREQVRSWLSENTAGCALTLLKDPRSSWTLELWHEVCSATGVELKVVAMLRHPAQVVGSRSTHYTSGIETMGELGYRVRNLAGWVNAIGITERQTRGWPRAFVRYDDLLTDWRSTVANLSVRLSLELGDLPAAPHPVDDFIDPGLSRHPLGWGDVEVLPELREVAQRAWQACCALADNGDREEAMADMAGAQQDYASMFSSARMLVQDAVTAEANDARREGVRRGRRQSARADVPGRGPIGRAAARVERRLRSAATALSGTERRS